MNKIPLDCGQINDEPHRPTKIFIYYPMDVDEHPYSDALRADLEKHDWRTWIDGLGRLCAAHKCLLPLGAEGLA